MRECLHFEKARLIFTSGIFIFFFPLPFSGGWIPQAQGLSDTPSMKKNTTQEL